MINNQSSQLTYPELHAGMPVVSSDDQMLGAVREVFRDVGVMETFGRVAAPPGNELFDPTQATISDSSIGMGDNFFTFTDGERETLYVPFSAIERIEGNRVMLAFLGPDIAAMGWDVRPDALASDAHEYPEDGGADSKVA